MVNGRHFEALNGLGNSILVSNLHKQSFDRIRMRKAKGNVLAFKNLSLRRKSEVDVRAVCPNVTKRWWSMVCSPQSTWFN